MTTLDQPIQIDAPPFTTRAATPSDLGEVTAAFMAMLKELEPLGHDVSPTRHNVAYFAANIFGPALDHDEHGIFAAYDDGDVLVGCTFFTPEETPLQLRTKRAVAHGIWVHPDYRRHGLALLLQDQAHERLRSLGYDELISCVVQANRAGMASCVAAGAVVTGYTTTVKLKGDI